LSWLPIAVSCAVFLVWATTLAEAMLSGRRLAPLGRVPPSDPPSGSWPTLSVVVPACNEAATIEPAMRTLLAQDYPDLEIVAVEDRSTDATRAILQRLAAEDPRLQLVPIDELPPGWLGKNHALATGAVRARGEILLFTDADVHLEPGALRSAVDRMLADRLDHFTMGAEMIAHNWWERSLLGFFAALFLTRYRPWRMANPRSRAHIGIGAFNMVRAEPYNAAGGHQALALEVIDDVKLGKLMKDAGGRCGFVSGIGQVRVRWVAGTAGLVRGLEKNSFAAFDFKPWQTVIAVLLMLPFAWWPWIGLAVGPPPARWICLATLACMAVASQLFACDRRAEFHHALGYPAAAAVVAYTILRSMVVTLRRGGIDWRGTFYSLETLRRARKQ
jgi:hypothetical protein